MADAELYTQYLSEVQKGSDAFKSAILIGTFLVGYFVACKSLLDAGAIALARVYNLGLSNKEMDFSKSKFWKQLKESHPTVHDRYMPFKGLFDEVTKWRDSAVHRLTPFVVTHSPGRPDKVSPEKRQIKMVAQPDTIISDIVNVPKSIRWVEPLHFRKKWQSRFIEFCEEVCLDIRGII